MQAWENVNLELLAIMLCKGNTTGKKGSKGVLKLSSQENPQRFNKELKKVL